ncbi:MAG: hypothetical protein E6H65_04350 [Betaproteobacteria bacterium]|nr:MAG: hypothetical protein E6H65_04350 [Betaproteobacteria bacterium]
MKKLRVQSLKWRLILQMLVILLPVTLLLAYQSWMDLRRAEVVDHAFQITSKAKQAHESFRRFVQGVSDAVDSGRVARPALAALDVARQHTNELMAEEPASDANELTAALDAIAGALASDASIARALPLRGTINFVDQRSDIARCGGRGCRRGGHGGRFGRRHRELLFQLLDARGQRLDHAHALLEAALELGGVGIRRLRQRRRGDAEGDDERGEAARRRAGRVHPSLLR